MEQTSSSSSVNSVAQLLSGSAGVTHIFVNLAIKNSAVEITYPEKVETNWINAQDPQSVQSE